MTDRNNPVNGVRPGESAHWSIMGPRWRKVSAVLSGLSEGVAAGDPKAVRAMGTAGFGHLGAFKRMVSGTKLSGDITVWHDYETVTEPYLEETREL